MKKIKQIKNILINSVLKFKALKLYTFIPLYFLSLLSSTAVAQPKTNLEIFYSLIDSSVVLLTDNLSSSEEINLELNLGDTYKVFNNKIIAALYSAGKQIENGNIDEQIPKISFVVDYVDTRYGEMFRSGFLGEYLLTRNLSLKGNFVVRNNSSAYREFNYSYRDTIRVEDIELVENESFPFTRGKIPAEPFFSGLLEPVIAIGTAALAVILFFTIRSK